MFLCTIYVHSAQGEQKRVLDALTLELQMVMDDHVGAGTPACVLFKRSKWSQFLSHLSSPICISFKM